MNIDTLATEPDTVEFPGRRTHHKADIDFALTLQFSGQTLLKVISIKWTPLRKGPYFVVPMVSVLERFHCIIIQ